MLQTLERLGVICLFFWFRRVSFATLLHTTRSAHLLAVGWATQAVARKLGINMLSIMCHPPKSSTSAGVATKKPSKLPLVLRGGFIPAPCSMTRPTAYWENVVRTRRSTLARVWRSTSSPA
ncbi:hypothetical protein B0I37DRAFT_195844 [Chaetomium sp. MPI-CAGE-AT-0009]|nr:hypothetical protein B0I37DRAFT_195844 [Chaetomium sp. MPI-CAGE-AT-0009]